MTVMEIYPKEKQFVPKASPECTFLYHYKNCL